MSEIKQKEKRELIDKLWTAFLAGMDIPNFEAGCALKLAEENYTKDLLSQALQKRDETILNKIKEYRCHMDEIHCSCMEALVEFINN